MWGLILDPPLSPNMDVMFEIFIFKYRDVVNTQDWK